MVSYQQLHLQDCAKDTSFSSTSTFDEGDSDVGKISDNSSNIDGTLEREEGRGKENLPSTSNDDSAVNFRKK